MIQKFYSEYPKCGTNVYTLYLKNGKRVVVSGVGTVVDVVAASMYESHEISGTMPGDDHSRRWDADRRFWEKMTIEYEA